MGDFLVATISSNVLRGRETMGKGIAVDFGSHEAKEKASQKLALPIAIVKPLSLFPGLSRACDHDWACSAFHCLDEIAWAVLAGASA
jgi:hypothetical protein